MVEIVSIVGGGLIGQSWAALFASAGYAVRVWDPIESARASFLTALDGPLAQLSSLGWDSDERGDVRVVDTLAECTAESILIQENAPENIDLKRDLYAKIESYASIDAIIASSTSSLIWSDLSAGMRYPQRFVTAHPFNPPHLMPLVELYGVDPGYADRAEEIYRRLKRRVVRLRKEAIGHIANRLSSALWREAVSIVAEGIADVEAVDTALVAGPGLRWSVIGPHLAYHLGGGKGGIEHYLAHLGPSQERRWASLGTPRLTPEVCDLLVAGVMAEAGGLTIEELEHKRDAALIAAIRAQEERHG